MPLYEYYCESCHGVFELLRPAREASQPQPCPECDSDSRRIVSNFQAFIFRDGYPRKIPDDGTYWHLGQKVRRPVDRAVVANAHPELLAKEEPPSPPTAEEREAYVQSVENYERAQAGTREAGLGMIRDANTEGKMTAFSQRVLQTARQGRLQRRKKSNAEVTPRTASGQHVIRPGATDNRRKSKP